MAELCKSRKQIFFGGGGGRRKVEPDLKNISLLFISDHGSYGYSHGGYSGYHGYNNDNY